MALILPTVGENKLLEFMLGKSTPGAQKLKLYVNDYTPIDGSTDASFTEMSTHGYGEKSLATSGWTVAQNGGVGEATHSQQSWTFTPAPAVTVYGYYVMDTTTSVLLWAERFATPRVVENDGDKIKITPKITLSKV